MGLAPIGIHLLLLSNLTTGYIRILHCSLLLLQGVRFCWSSAGVAGENALEHALEGADRATDPAGGAYSAAPNPLAVIKGACF